MKEDTKAYGEIATNWQTLRSQLYLHHRGICWVCHEPIELQDYEVGHLVDRCNGGKDAIENVAPMHKWCNNSKPRHNTLEEHITWLLKTKWLEQKPVPQFPDMPPATNKPYPYRRNHNGTKQKTRLSVIGLESNRTLFEPSPALQNTSDAIKLEVIKLLSKVLDTPAETQNAQLYHQPKPTIQSQVQLDNYSHEIYRHQKRITRPPIIRPPKPLTLEQKTKIVPMTICWVQGRPIGGAMWKILPPPYRQEDLFSARETPLGATDNGEHNMRNTIQVIGGTLSQQVTVSLGHVIVTISPTSNGKPSITFAHSKVANVGKREQTVGRGKGQIPIEVWRQAKSKGISFKDFVTNYNNPANSPATNAVIRQVLKDT